MIFYVIFLFFVSDDEFSVFEVRFFIFQHQKNCLEFRLRQRFTLCQKYIGVYPLHGPEMSVQTTIKFHCVYMECFYVNFVKASYTCAITSEHASLAFIVS